MNQHVRDLDFDPGEGVRYIGPGTWNGKTGHVVGFRWPSPHEEPHRVFYIFETIDPDTLKRSHGECSAGDLTRT